MLRLDLVDGLLPLCPTGRYKEADLTLVADGCDGVCRSQNSTKTNNAQRKSSAIVGHLLSMSFLPLGIWLAFFCFFNPHLQGHQT
jgi:hypothetical protein